MEIDRNNTFKSGSNPKVDCDMYIEDGISRFIVKYQEAYAIYPGQVISYNVSVYKDFKNKNEMYGRAIGYKANNYVIKDSLNIIDWKLQDFTKIINGENCKLALYIGEVLIGRLGMMKILQFLMAHLSYMVYQD